MILLSAPRSKFSHRNRSDLKATKHRLRLHLYLLISLILLSFSQIAQALTCSVSSDNWGGGYVTSVTVTNDSNSPVNDWQVTLSHNQNPGVSSSWNANLQTNGNQITASNVDWNGSLAPGQSAAFGYQGSVSGNFQNPTCSANGEDSSQPTAAPTPSPTAQPTSIPTSTPTPQPSSAPNPAASIEIQENQNGFCQVDGTVDSNNSGYSGSGFANTDNQLGTGITWSVNVADNGNYDLQWYFANGGTSNRSGSVLINNDDQASLGFDSTSSWSDWNNSQRITVYMSAGQNTIQLVSNSSSGLANIDKITIFGPGVSPGDCAGTPSPTVVPTPIPTAVPTTDPGSGDGVTTGSSPTIWYASDSTVRHYSPNSKNQQGVGQRLPEFLVDQVKVANYAKGGRAVNSFISDGFWGDILDGVSPGDVILIQFGINDRSDVPDKEVFKEYLRRYAREARAKQAIPVFVTPTPRNQHSNGVFTNAFTKYCEAKEEVGAELGVTVIDLQTKGRNFYTQIGPDRVTNEMMIDTLHLAVMGAYHMARLLAEGIAESNLSPLRNQIIHENLDPGHSPSVDGWSPRSGYSHN